MVYKSKYIKSIFLPEIKKLGFEYKTHDIQTWIFMRKKENIEQYINIAFFYNNTAIRLYFSTNAYGRESINASKVASQEEYPCDIGGMILFSNDEELVLLLKSFAEICGKYANEVLEEISTPISKYWPSKDMQIELYEKHSGLFNELKTIYHIDENSSSDEYISAITSLIKNISEESEEIFKQGVIKAAALLGEFYVSTLGGFWKLDGGCIIMNVGNDPNLRAYLINNIYLSWQRNDCDLFLRHYNNLKNKTYVNNNKQ